MLKDRRDDFDDNDDVDLTGMIHQYNEDNELRRKINEMKKQKESASTQPDFDPSDSALMGNMSTQNDEVRIPNIRADQDVEKTRVGFNDDGDKTLVIMDRKTRVEAKPEDMYDDYSYVEPKKQTTAFRNEPIEETGEYEDLKKVVKNKKEKKIDDFEEDEKTKRINKIIMISIISVISIVLLVGIGFGVKYMFFNNDSSDSETTTNNKKPANNKKPSSNTNSGNKNDKDNIEDNSAIVAQLNAQLSTYQTQINDVNAQMIEAKGQIDYYAGKLTAITNLQTAYENAMMDFKQEDYDKALNEKNKACTVSADSKECLDATETFKLLNDQKVEIDTANAAYNIEAKKKTEYDTSKANADKTYSSLQQQKTDLEKKVASTTTELAKYN